MGILQSRTINPKTMSAVVIESAKGSVNIKESETPVPKKNEVLIKVLAAPINPSDVAFMNGQYNYMDKFPTLVGFTGAGEVVASGGGLFARRLIGKNVAFAKLDAGTFSQYTTCSALMCFPLDKTEDINVASNCVANPITALAFLDLILTGNHKAVILTAACSQCSLQTMRLCKEFKVKTINVIRRQEQEDMLKEIGVDVVLNQNDLDFEDRLREISSALGATICFEAVAGDLPKKIIKNMPKNSILYLYGGLSGTKLDTIDGGDLLFKGKCVKGFHLSRWFETTSYLSMVKLYIRHKRYRKTLLTSEVSKTFPLQEINDAILFYKKNMTAGKVVIRPNN